MEYIMNEAKFYNTNFNAVVTYRKGNIYLAVKEDNPMKGQKQIDRWRVLCLFGFWKKDRYSVNVDKENREDIEITEFVNDLRKLLENSKDVVCLETFTDFILSKCFHQF